MSAFDVIVIGQGYAGLTAARLANERGLRTANFEVNCFGGLILNLNELHPAPEGEPECGSELASTLAMANMDNGVECLSEEVTGLDRTGDGWTVLASGARYTARHVIVASGARLRKLGVPGEAEFFGQGVSECADCDGPMFKGQEAVIVGGGDSAFQEALALAAFASKVTIVMRGSTPRARAEWQEQVAAAPNITLLPNTQVLAIEGAAGKGVESVLLRTEGQGERRMACGGVFVFIGLAPNTGFLPGEVALDDVGAVRTSENCATALPGLWAIGAARSGFGGTLEYAREDAQRVLAAIV
jgi:thioredoxin reductase (NADPH)